MRNILVLIKIYLELRVFY